jgi:hypothetical protein
MRGRKGLRLGNIKLWWANPKEYPWLWGRVAERIYVTGEDWHNGWMTPQIYKGSEGSDMFRKAMNARRVAKWYVIYRLWRFCITRYFSDLMLPDAR